VRGTRDRDVAGSSLTNSTSTRRERLREILRRLRASVTVTCRVTALFQKVFSMTFPRLFHDQKMKIHDLSAQHIFPNKRYTTYECLRELLVTVAAAYSSVVKKIKSEVYLHMFTNISQQAVQHDFICCS